MLTEDLLAPVEGSWLAEPLANLRSRLSATLTPTGVATAPSFAKPTSATVFGSGHYGEKRAELEAIHEAIEKQHRVRNRLRHPRQATEARTIDPYCTWFAAGRVYVVAYCHKARRHPHLRRPTHQARRGPGRVLRSRSQLRSRSLHPQRLRRVPRPHLPRDHRLFPKGRPPDP